MKDTNKLKDYRLKYKRYYGIEFGNNYVIHHIDFDRTNNDISNLLLLPRELHAKYHLVINSISICPEKPMADGFINVRLSNKLISTYEANMFEHLPEVIIECNKWVEWKKYNYDDFFKSLIFAGTE